MGTNPLATGLLALCLATAPVLPAAAERVRTTPAETTPGPRPATPDELARYGDREEAAKQEKLEEFEGGRRGRGTEATTIIIILLVVILVVLII